MGRLADKARQYLEQHPQQPDGMQAPAPAFPEGEMVYCTHNDGTQQRGIVRWANYQTNQPFCLAGWWYWIESDQVDSWTHESRISQLREPRCQI